MIGTIISSRKLQPRCVRPLQRRWSRKARLIPCRPISWHDWGTPRMRWTTHPFGSAPVQDDDDKGALFSRSALDRLPPPQSANQKTRWRVPAGLKLIGIRGGGWSESRHPDSTTMPRFTGFTGMFAPWKQYLFTCACRGRPPSFYSHWSACGCSMSFSSTSSKRSSIFKMASRMDLTPMRKALIITSTGMGLAVSILRIRTDLAYILISRKAWGWRSLRSSSRYWPWAPSPYRSVSAFLIKQPSGCTAAGLSGAGREGVIHAVWQKQDASSDDPAPHQERNRGCQKQELGAIRHAV